ncbi:MAG: thiamine pyrophosphate-binding protein [Thermoanaerobaculia bacterium]
MGNVARARQLIADLRAAGVTDVCVCAGSRNSPLLVAVGTTPGLAIYSFVDERSAAFFALGRAKLRQRPVAVITTSGTAVAEMLPAAIEAFYSGVPLVLVSADRPARFRGTGAPQCIDQETLFGPHADTSIDEWRRDRPLHINLEFDEPLIDADEVAEEHSSLSVARWSPHAEPMGREPRDLPFARPVVILGGVDAKSRERVRDFCLALSAPVYAEPLSGLREDSALAHLAITSGERMLARGRFDGVIRIGNIPTLRFWRDLEESRRDLPVVHFSSLPFAGMTRGEVLPLEALPHPTARDRDDGFFARDREQAAKLAAVLDEEPESELAMLRALSLALSERTRLYLGNSLPIREWDLVASRESRPVDVQASRGANGIDGQLSTFFGQCAPEADNLCVVGDLTAIYDLNAPWIVPQLGDVRFRIVIVNNGGGRIFSRVTSMRALGDPLRERLVENAHTIRFDHWSAMWGIEDRVTELRPDPEASRRAWARYDDLWA